MNRIDQEFSPAPLEEAVVLSPAWLNYALGQAHPGVDITGVETVERLDLHKMTTKVRFRITQRTSVPGLPDALCVKAFFNPERMHLSALGRTEANFYRSVANGLDLGVPPCHYAGIDEATGHGLVIMSDLTDPGARFLEPLARFSVEQAASTLAHLARLHAATWGAAAAPFKSILFDRAQITAYFGPDQLDGLLKAPRHDHLPRQVRDGARVHAAVTRLMADVEGPQAVLHGDLHAGNIHLRPDGSSLLVDWQMAQVGSWAQDVAYHLAITLEPDDRRASERELLHHYLECLKAEGIAAPSSEDAWVSYRRCLLYGLYLWGVTTNVPAPIPETNLHRLAAAVLDHDSFGLIGL